MMGVRFRVAGPIAYCEPSEFTFGMGGRVVVGHPLTETVSVIIEATSDDDYHRTVDVPLDQLQLIRTSAN